MNRQRDIPGHLAALYGDALGARTFARLAAILNAFRAPARPARLGLSERDAILITYGDQLRAEGESPLKTLAQFCDAHLQGVVSAVHLLPFYPYTSDDGFSVVDYRAVNPALGDWSDVARVGSRFDLMFDAVVNHVSASSRYVRGFMEGDPAFRDYVIRVADPQDARLARVIRPRALPLLTPLDTPRGRVHVWSTFSADQIDLNFGNPEVLLEILDVLLFYVERGARFIRLDAIAFLWKELGTSCLHLPQTHRVVQLMRSVLDQVAPEVQLITETNVPHSDNISYFGDGSNEAQLVYNFALPPLVVHSMRTGDARKLSQWASSLSTPSANTAFFNFLASHDGIGLNPVRGILSDVEVDALVRGTLDRGGMINVKHNPDGSTSPYEMNINFLDAILPQDYGSEEDGDDTAPAAARALAAHAVMLSLAGVPGVYFHSLFGSRGWRAGVATQGHNRAINRQKLGRAEVEAALSNPASLRRRVFDGLQSMLRLRSTHRAFHPAGAQRVLDVDPAVFAVVRTAPGIEPGDLSQAYRNRVVCLTNLSDKMQIVSVDWREWLGTRNAIHDLISGARLNVHGPSLALLPFQVMWATI